jgi:hypothetical protein
MLESIRTAINNVIVAVAIAFLVLVFKVSLNDMTGLAIIIWLLLEADFHQDGSISFVRYSISTLDIFHKNSPIF